MLTGWTFLPAGDNPEHGGEFTFNRRLHEPGPQKVLGKVYADTGVEQGRAVLRDLAAHPATATHVAPSWRATSSPTSRRRRWSRGWRKGFRDTGGDLKEVAKALVASPEAWALPRTKLKRPSEWVDLDGARCRDHPGGRGPLHRRPGHARRAAVAPAVAQGLCR